MHQLIQTEKTGNPNMLANRLGISRSTLYRILDELKSYDAPIEYSRKRETFYYSKFYEFKIHCSIILIDDDVELRKIIGGDKNICSRLYIETGYIYIYNV